MNAGTPAVALRALRLTPVLVDDHALVRELGRSDPVRGAGSDLDAPEAELVRWTRAWLVAWQAELYARSVIGRVHAWDVSIPRDEWPRLKGDPDHRRRDAAVALLVRTGLAGAAPPDHTRHARAQLAPDASARVAPDTLVLTERAFVEHRAGLEIDWSAAYRACRAEPATLLTLRAVVDCLPVLDDPGPVTLRELALRTDYGEKQLRLALRRLVEANVLATHDAPGQPTRYRVTDRLLGRTNEPPAGRPSPVVLDNSPPAIRRAPDTRAAAPPQPGAPASGAPAFRLTLNGATLTLPPGLTADVEIDDDGVPHLRIRTAPRP